MKVLHLPTNTASQISITVRALRDIGVDARGSAIDPSPLTDSAGITKYELGRSRTRPVRCTCRKLASWWALRRQMHWADVVHWHSRPRTVHFGFRPEYVAKLGKARIVEFWGSDVRIPEIAAADNPHVAQMYEACPQLAEGAGRRSLKTQARLARCGFECMVPGFELETYLHRDLFPKWHRSKARLILADYRPEYPDPRNRRPVVVHAPSSRAIKGTEAVLRAVEQLKGKLPFDFRLIHGVDRRTALQMMRGCDVMLDQFTLGAHGLAALEAMALGKPVLCYIKPSLLPKYPPELPIVIADQENLADVLAGLLADGTRRHELGRRSRAYVEKYHDAHKLAHQFVDIYRELLENVCRNPDPRRLAA